VGSLDAFLARFSSRVLLQPHRQELITGMRRVAHELITDFIQANAGGGAGLACAGCVVAVWAGWAEGWGGLAAWVHQVAPRGCDAGEAAESLRLRRTTQLLCCVVV
jgi:hypothetical protein